MSTDQEKLKNIYEVMYRSKLDYLNLESHDVFDWVVFYEEYDLQKFYLFEAFRHLKDNKILNGIESLYEITSQNNSSYICKLNWIKAESKIWECTQNLMYAKQKNIQDVNKIQTLLQSLKENSEKYILYVYFEDSEGNTKLTKKTNRNESFIVFKGLENAIRDFFASDNRLDNTLAVRFLVDKNELKRMELYKNIALRIDGLTKFSEILIDVFSSGKYNMVTIF